MNRTGGVKVLDESLRDLWRRRDTLSEVEWAELYAAVFRILRYRYKDLVAQIGSTPEESIQDFFQDKVFVVSGGELVHAGALVVFYKNYLLSRLREPRIQRETSFQSNSLLGGETSSQSDDLPNSGVSAQDEGQGDIGGVQSVVDSITEMLLEGPADMPLKLPVDSVLRDVVLQYTGVDLERVVQGAADFLHGKGEWADLANDAWWMRLYLRCHFCPESEDAIPMSQIARRYSVPSYHSKAIKLGVTVPKGRDAALEAFRDSYRGRWLVSVGVPIDPEHLLEMSVSLKILCAVALRSQEPC
jgi:hypothetical protein